MTTFSFFSFQARSDHGLALPLGEVRRLAEELPDCFINEEAMTDFDLYMYHAGRYYSRVRERTEYIKVVLHLLLGCSICGLMAYIVLRVVAVRSIREQLQVVDV